MAAGFADMANNEMGLEATVQQEDEDDNPTA
jgi:hypothetical protein